MFTVTVERPAGTDRFGNPNVPATYTVGDCWTAPAGSTERHHLEGTVEWDLDMFAPHGAPLTPVPPAAEPAGIGAQDVVLLPDDTTRYQVYGKPKTYTAPTGWEAGTIVRLKAVEG